MTAKEMNRATFSAWLDDCVKARADPRKFERRWLWWATYAAEVLAFAGVLAVLWAFVVEF